MNRGMLVQILANDHYVDDPDRYYSGSWDCACGNSFKEHREWADHVADIILGTADDSSAQA